MTNHFKEESKELTVTVVDGADATLDAEAMAMLSSLTSRSQSGPKANLALVEEKGAAAFMDRYYVGYGHSSIGKTGHTNIFVSGLSMIAINIIQNINPLYVGQESSTRYIPFESEGVYLPEHMEAKWRPLINDLMDLYIESVPIVKAYLFDNLTKPADVSDKQWDGMLDARAFDICRSMLPAGCKTVGVWNGNLENFRQTLEILLHHHNPEVVAVAKEMYSSLQSRYPSSFPLPMFTFDMENWLGHVSISNTIYGNDGVYGIRNDITPAANSSIMNMPTRPKYARIPDEIGIYGRINYSFPLDFGGYRDVNRHRKGNCKRSFLTPNSDIHPWYTDAMPTEIASRFDDLMNEMRERLLWDEDLSNWDIEYITPMGVMVDVMVSYPLDNAVYFAELRSGPTVHPTVREVARDLGDYLNVNYPFEMYHNTDNVDSMDPRRSEQTITEK